MEYTEGEQVATGDIDGYGMGIPARYETNLGKKCIFSWYFYGTASGVESCIRKTYGRIIKCYLEIIIMKNPYQILGMN